MKRCTPPSNATLPRATRRGQWVASLAGLALLTLLPTLAQAQSTRPFPAKALRGTLVVQQPPIVTIDGHEARLSPGARIRSADNLLLRSATLVGQELTVNYVLEQHGLVHQVWILTEAEAAEKRPRAGD